MKFGPPKDISPGKLFRILTEPRPCLPIAYRVAGFESVALSVRALPCYEWAQIEDDCADVSGSLIQSMARGSLVARALLADGQRAFARMDEVRDLSIDEYDGLSNAVLDALDRMGPPSWRRDESEWLTYLRDGALNSANEHDAKALGACYDGGAYSPVVDRPERYFGLPVRELTHGHWLVFRVCRELHEKGYR